jgi:hypothetical protein
MGLKPEKFWQERRESSLQLFFGGLKRRLFAGKTIINRFEFRAGISAMPKSQRFFYKILY